MSKKAAAKPPCVYVIAGANGAGKTTFATQFLPSFVECREFLNADMIAHGLSPFAPGSQNIRAGRLLLERIDELAAQNVDFGFETTLSGRTYVKLLNRMKNAGYRVTLFFLWLPSADLAVTRVASRIKNGGHAVPEDDVRRRFAAGLKNLFRLYLPLADSWRIYDASRMPPKRIARFEGGMLRVSRRRLYRQIVSAVEDLP